MISSTRIGKPVLMMDVKVSKDKHISRWVDQENLSYVRPSIKTKKVIDTGKRSKTLSEVKPAINIKKNLQSFLEISHVQKEVLPSHKLLHYAYEY